MNTTVLLAVIFPANLPYFSAFRKSISRQTTNQFDILIGNDGVVEPVPLEGLKNVSVIQVIGSPMQTRLSLLHQAADRGYKKFIFADTDDELSENRIHVISGLMDRADCICNDVDLIDVTGNLIAGQYWNKRLSDEQVIDADFLADKNIIGFGNTGLTARAVESMGNFEATQVPAPDWLYFSLLVRKNSALFTSDCTTRYRQHADNLIGIKTVTAERLTTIIRVKTRHYQLLADAGIDTTEYLHTLNQLQEKIASPEGMARALDTLKALNINYFWWEETNYLK